MSLDAPPLPLLTLALARASEQAALALARYDERLVRSDAALASGALRRAEIADAQASVGLGGGVATLEDIVLNDAGMDSRTPTGDVVRAVAQLGLRRAIERRDPETLFDPETVSAMLGLAAMPEGGQRRRARAGVTGTRMKTRMRFFPRRTSRSTRATRICPGLRSLPPPGRPRWRPRSPRRMRCWRARAARSRATMSRMPMAAPSSTASGTRSTTNRRGSPSGSARSRDGGSSGRLRRGGCARPLAAARAVRTERRGGLPAGGGAAATARDCDAPPAGPRAQLPPRPLPLEPAPGPGDAVARASGGLRSGGACSGPATSTGSRSPGSCCSGAAPAARRIPACLRSRACSWPRRW